MAARSPFHGTTSAHLAALARDLASGRVVAPFSSAWLASCGHRGPGADTVGALRRLAKEGVIGAHLPVGLEPIVGEPKLYR